MKEIKCPECGKVFTIDENSYAAIQKQVRDREFNEELKRQKDSAVQLAEAEKDRVIADLRGQVHQLHAERTSPFARRWIGAETKRRQRIS